MKPYSKLKTGIILLVLVVFFVVLNVTNFSKTTKNFFYLISLPIEKSLWQGGVGFSNFFEGIFQSENLKNENTELRLQNQRLLSRILTINEVEKENKVLREALNLGIEKDFELITSQIILKDISKDSLLIDKGLKDGVKKGLPLITSQKVLLGRIGEVYENFSEVILVSNKESSFDAKISRAEGETKEIYGVVKGEGDLKLYLDLVPKENEILKDDLVVSAALGGIFPQGLLVGKVKTIKISDLEPFQKAEIEPAFSLKELDKIFIINRIPQVE